ncbi:MAG: universal stress protein [Verrucomicrobia bacterium]|nr:universal stress protein [Verrucomicrobiota bacterium]
MKPKSTRVPARAATSKVPRIICGTDFSENARQGSRAAAAIAKRLNGPALLVHALDFPRYAAESKADVFRVVTASRRKSLHQEAESIRKAGVTVEVQLHPGRADEALVDLARKGLTRLLVVASLGRRGAERWLLGSVSERTAECATVPTLVVRDAAPFEAWTRGERPLKVFVAFNSTVTSEAALRWVKELAAIGPCEVVVGYVAWPPEQRRRLGDAGSLPLVGNPPEVQAVLERDVRARAVELLGEIPFRPRVEANWGRPDVRLAEMAKEEAADLIVVGSHQYRGFERLWHTSVSRGLLHSATMSVAVVPLSTREKRGAGVAPPVRRVLVTTDFSDLANHAIPHAHSLLRGGGTVHLVHVMHPQALPGGEYLHGPPDRQFEARHAKHVEACAAKLRALIPAEAAALGILTEVAVVEHRDAAEGICQAAERFGADVICLGTHGRSGVEKALMGSVAQKVMTHSRRPLLTVRPPLE